ISPGSVYFGFGAVMATRIAKLLKLCFRKPRPAHSTEKLTYGMPSTHSTTIIYYATYVSLAAALLPPEPPYSFIPWLLPPLTIMPLATSIALSRSSITDWVEILSSDRYKENDYDGIPELVDAINLQAEGPSEASRAIRKKLKYGDVHRQLRALTLLRALVENCGSKFQSSFADDALITRIKALATNPLTDESVKRKLLSLLASWHRQFKDDAKMSTIANLWGSVGGGK
ncbi:putative actin patch assembly and actin polymerization protein, partial [Tulasnella sp. 403]